MSNRGDEDDAFVVEVLIYFADTNTEQRMHAFKISEIAFQGLTKPKPDCARFFLFPLKDEIDCPSAFFLSSENIP